MKLAAVSDDGVTISQHFGRAPCYIVLTMQGTEIIARERRDKMGHAQFAGEPHESGGHDASGLHGFDAAAQGRHARMATAIADCQVLLARGMGAGAYESLKQAGITPVVTDVANIDDAARDYMEGRLVDRTELLH